MQIRSLIFRGALMVLVGALSIPASAQDDDQSDKQENQDKEVQAEVEIDSLKALQADFLKRQTAYFAAARSAGRDPEKRKEVQKLTPDVSAYVEAIAGFAADNPDKKELKKALFGVLRQARATKDRKLVTDLLVKNFIEIKRMLQCVPFLRGNEDSLRQVYEANEHVEVKVAALYYLIGTLETKKKRAEDKDAVATELDELMAVMLEKYADAEDARKVTYVSRLKGQKFLAERLQIGMEVPDIVGEDVDGVEFKLSDYRGKVVVIDFWGDW